MFYFLNEAILWLFAQSFSKCRAGKGFEAEVQAQGKTSHLSYKTNSQWGGNIFQNNNLRSLTWHIFIENQCTKKAQISLVSWP